MTDHPDTAKLKQQVEALGLYNKSLEQLCIAFENPDDFHYDRNTHRLIHPLPEAKAECEKSKAHLLKSGLEVPDHWLATGGAYPQVVASLDGIRNEVLREQSRLEGQQSRATLQPDTADESQGDGTEDENGTAKAEPSGESREPPEPTADEKMIARWYEESPETQAETAQTLNENMKNGELPKLTGERFPLTQGKVSAIVAKVNRRRKFDGQPLIPTRRKGKAQTLQLDQGSRRHTGKGLRQRGLRQRSEDGDE